MGNEETMDLPGTPCPGPPLVIRHGPATEALQLVNLGKMMNCLWMTFLESGLNDKPGKPGNPI